jgi:hypothetical protein
MNVEKYHDPWQIPKIIQIVINYGYQYILHKFEKVQYEDQT